MYKLSAHTNKLFLCLRLLSNTKNHPSQLLPVSNFIITYLRCFRYISNKLLLEDITSRKEEIGKIRKEKPSNSSKAKNIKKKRRKIANKIYEFLVLNGLTIERRKFLCAIIKYCILLLSFYFSMLVSIYYTIDVLLFLRYYYSIILLLYYFSGCYYLTIVCRLFYLTRRWWLVAGRFALQGRCTLPDDGGTDAFSWHPGEFRRKVSPWPARGVRSLWRRKLFAGPDLVADFALSRRLRRPWLSFHPAYIVVIERSRASPNKSENHERGIVNLFTIIKAFSMNVCYYVWKILCDRPYFHFIRKCRTSSRVQSRNSRDNLKTPNHLNVEWKNSGNNLKRYKSAYSKLQKQFTNSE